MAGQSAAGGEADQGGGGVDELVPLGPGLMSTGSANFSQLTAVPAASAKSFSTSKTLADTQLLSSHNSAGQ